MKEQYLNLLSTNAADLKSKAEDLKNKVRFFDVGIFAVQETHYRKKGRFKLNNFEIFESIRKKKKIRKREGPCLVCMWLLSQF